VDHAGLVRGFEAGCDLDADVERLLDRERPAAQPLGECLARHELEHEEVRVAHLIDTVNLRDVWVIERGQRLRLAREALQALLVLRELLGQDLDRHFAIESRVLRAVDLAHGSGPERPENPVVRECVA
jgi:hypothetical protein